MKKVISEELNYIKYLFDYKKGVVISEQSVVTDTTTFDPSNKTKSTINQTKSVNLPVVDEPEPSPSKPAISTTQTVSTTNVNTVELESQKKQLETQLSSIQSSLDVLNRKNETEERQRVESSIIKKIEDLDTYLRSNCGKKMTKLCKEYLKEKNSYNQQMATLRNLATKEGPNMEKNEKDAADKTQKWITVVNNIISLFTSAIAATKLAKTQ